MISTFLIILTFTFGVFILGVLLSLAAKKFNVEPKDPMQHLVERCLPGVQCGQCGYIGCAEYANAIILEHAPINLCTPGGDATIKALADVMHMPIPEVSNNNDENNHDMIAYIHEDKCIGCTKCAKACPYDAIMGKIKEPHKVDENFCTGCKKCIETCPTKCIEMKTVEVTTDTWNWDISEKEMTKND
jgi:Na+-translocating ferredoxin:NAD+ oxidoreductase subunit B